MIYAILFLVAFGCGVLCAGYVVSVVGGIKTDLATAKLKLTNLETSVTADIAALKAKLP